MSVTSTPHLCSLVNKKDPLYRGLQNIQSRGFPRDSFQNSVEKVVLRQNAVDNLLLSILVVVGRLIDLTEGYVDRLAVHSLEPFVDFLAADDELTMLAFEDDGVFFWHRRTADHEAIPDLDAGVSAHVTAFSRKSLERLNTKTKFML